MNKLLPILAIETSGDLCSTAVLLNEESYSVSNVRSKNIHSEKLLQLVDNSLSSLNFSMEDIKLVAVSIGPGSFTGLRIGMSTAKGLAFGKGLPIVPVPTFESLAFQFASVLPDGQKFIIVNKVNIDEIFFAKFESEQGLLKIVEDVHLIKKQDLAARCLPDCLIYGNFSSNELQIIHVLPEALFTARWAYFFGKDLVTSSYEYLEPNYLKNFIVKDKK